jgi:hypothetical protein
VRGTAAGRKGGHLACYQGRLVLLDELDQLIAEPPFTAQAARSAADVLPAADGPRPRLAGAATG